MNERSDHGAIFNFTECSKLNLHEANEYVLSIYCLILVVLVDPKMQELYGLFLQPIRVNSHGGILGTTTNGYKLKNKHKQHRHMCVRITII